MSPRHSEALSRSTRKQEFAAHSAKKLPIHRIGDPRNDAAGHEVRRRESRARLPGFPRPRGNQAGRQEAIDRDINQYAITWGAKSLRNAIAAKFERTQG